MPIRSVEELDDVQTQQTMIAESKIDVLFTLRGALFGPKMAWRRTWWKYRWESLKPSAIASCRWIHWTNQPSAGPRKR